MEAPVLLFGFCGYLCTTNYTKRLVMDEKRELEYLLKNIQDGLGQYSIKELNQALIEALDKKSLKRQEINFVLETVAEHYKISVRTLRKAQTRGAQQEAKQICYCLLHFDLGLPVRHIAKRIFFNWPSSVKTGITKFKKIQPKVKAEKDFLDAYTCIQLKLNEYLKSKHSKNGNE